MLLIPAETCCIALSACDLGGTANQHPFFIQIIDLFLLPFPDVGKADIV